MHIYDSRYPSAPTATFTPPDASVADYLKVRARLGITRTVVVQPSTYGTDNRCTLAAIAALGDSARGIAVVDQTVTDAELDRLTKAGIRGIRFHMLPGGALPWDILETMAARVGNFGWHVQLQLDGRTLPDREPLLKRLTGTLVVDHVGKFLQPIPVDHPGFLVLLRLLENGRTWVKLSAPMNGRRPGRRTTPTSDNWPTRSPAPRPTACCGRPTGRIRRRASTSPTTPGRSTCCWSGCPTR